MKVVSLFSGAGGMDLGFRHAGFELVWANDIDVDAVATYARNIGPHVVSANIAEIPSAAVPPAEVVIGGFPCQGFSVANWNRTKKDGRNALYKQMLRVVRETKPAYFVAENVKGLAYMEGGKVLERIIRDFEDIGYRVQHAVLNAADYGVPQRRERIFIVGHLPSAPPPAFPPSPTHAERGGQGLRPWVGCGDALAGLPDPDSKNAVANHTYSKYKLTFNGHLGHRRIDPALPAPTVTGRGDNRGGVVVLHHPSNERRMSVRELATIQGFPQDFEFVATQSVAYRLVANAVPPPLAAAVAGCIPQPLAVKARASSRRTA